MNSPFMRSKVIQGAAGLSSKKELNNAIIKGSFARHFMDSIDYHDDTVVNGVEQRLIVARNKNVVTERKIYAYPGESFPLGALVECFDCKWLVTEIDPNHEQYYSGKMQQCNRQVVWQDPDTLEIISRWITMDKPYFSNLDENAHNVISTRMFKIYMTYDEYTSKLHVDKRFMLEFINGEPITYRVTSADVETRRYTYGDSHEGLVCLYIEQDQYNEHTDNRDLMICDYIEPNTRQPQGDIPFVEITYKGEPTIKIGGSAKKLVVDSKQNSDIAVHWNVRVLDEYFEFVRSEIVDNDLYIKVLPNSLMEDATVRVELLDPDNLCLTYVELKVVTLI